MLLVRYHHRLGFKPESLLNQQIDAVIGSQGINLIFIGMGGNDVKRLLPYRAC